MQTRLSANRSARSILVILQSLINDFGEYLLVFKGPMYEVGQYKVPDSSKLLDTTTTLWST